MAQRLKHLPTTWETWVRSLGWEDPLEKEIATHSSFLAWRIPMDREAWQATVYGAAKSQTQLKQLSASTAYPPGRVSSPLQHTSSLGHVGSFAAVHTLAVACGLSCSTAGGVLVPRPGFEPRSPSLQGRFLTTGPPGKSRIL